MCKLGKIPLPFIRTKDLIWDSDLNPEGIAVKHVLGGDAVELMLNGAVFYAEERSSTDDTYMYGGQVAAKMKPSQDSFVLGGASLFYWDNVEGFPVLFDPLDGFGNDVVEVTDASGTVTELLYAEDFSELEFFAQIGLNLGIPVKLYGDYVVNTEADRDDTGYQLGATLGKAKDPGSVELDYNYRDLEANAIIGAFTDSDFIGGGTNGEGHRVQAKYQLSKNWQFSATILLNNIDPDGSDVDYKRGQFDLIAKF